MRKDFSVSTRYLGTSYFQASSLPMRSHPLCKTTMLLTYYDHFHGESYNIPWGKKQWQLSPWVLSFHRWACTCEWFSQYRSKPALTSLIKQQIVFQWNTKEAYNIHYFKNVPTWSKHLVCLLIAQLVSSGSEGEVNKWTWANAKFAGVWDTGKGRCLCLFYDHISVQFEIILIKCSCFVKVAEFLFVWIYLRIQSLHQGFLSHEGPGLSVVWGHFLPMILLLQKCQRWASFELQHLTNRCCCEDRGDPWSSPLLWEVRTTKSVLCWSEVDGRAETSTRVSCQPKVGWFFSYIVLALQALPFLSKVVMLGAAFLTEIGLLAGDWPLAVASLRALVVPYLTPVHLSFLPPSNGGWQGIPISPWALTKNYGTFWWWLVVVPSHQPFPWKSCSRGSHSAFCGDPHGHRLPSRHKGWV